MHNVTIFLESEELKGFYRKQIWTGIEIHRETLECLLVGMGFIYGNKKTGFNILCRNGSTKMIMHQVLDVLSWNSSFHSSAYIGIVAVRITELFSLA